MVGPKRRYICPRINMLKGFFFWNNHVMKYGSSKSAEIVLQKSIFYVKNPRNWKKNHLRILIQETIFCKNIFSNFNFWTTLFSKIMPNFWQTGAPHILKIQWFPLSILIFGQKSCFLGPTIFKIPQPNWYYYILDNTYQWYYSLYLRLYRYRTEMCGHKTSKS